MLADVSGAEVETYLLAQGLVQPTDRPESSNRPVCADGCLDVIELILPPGCLTFAGCES